MFQFDDLGYIFPYEVHDLTLEEFERTFVIDSERERLFKALMNLVLDLKNLGAGEFYIWADGSFVTKKRVPGDIDLVCFIDYQQFEKIEPYKEVLKNRYDDWLDIFFERSFPEDHPKYFTTVGKQLRWKELFGYDRHFNRKGLILIRF